MTAVGVPDLGLGSTMRRRDSGEMEAETMDTDHPAAAGPRKRKRIRKVNSDRKFECTHEGCGKSYSRAEHLYRHQLNHTPKQIYRCDFPDCYRTFVRQDLCVRHRERHTTQGSQLQKRDHFAQTATQNKTGVPGSQELVDGNRQPSMDFPSARPAVGFPDGGVETLTPQSVNGGSSKHTRVSSSGAVPLGRPLSYPPLNLHHGVGTPDSTVSRSNSLSNQSINSPPGQANASPFSPPDLPQASYVPLTGHHSIDSLDSPLGQAHRLTASNLISRTRHSDNGPTYSIPSDVSGPALVESIPYASAPGLSMPMGGYGDLPMNATAPATQASMETTANLGALDSISGIMASADPAFDPMASCVYPIFGGETYNNRSPFAMAEDFTAWLFNEPMPGTSSLAYPTTTAMVPNYLDPTQLQNQFLMGDPGIGSFFNGVLPQHPMSVTSILDPGSPRAIMSEEKRQELLHLMSTRFNEAAYSAVAKRKDALMDGDMDDDDHVLSLRMMQTFIGSYWYHFHTQLPILHQPTFVADKAPNLLLLAVMAIGAATLDNIHGQEVTETAAELANFIGWHLRWEIFMDADFRPPAKLWVFQALLLLEVFEKMYSTRALHERAHIHHDTTLTLMRRGSSLIGRSALDSPASFRDDRHTRSTTGSTSVSDFAADDSWTHWIKAEAMRRVAFAAFVLDSTHATMFGHSAKMVAHELRLPLPCDEALWSATSAAEVARVQSSLHANGVKPTMFLDGLKKTLNGQRVTTNAFGRTILMTGLLSVSWHMNQRDLQVSSLGVPQALGGRDKWRSALLRAFDNWRRDFDEAIAQAGPAPFPSPYRVRNSFDEESVSESRDVLHGLAHMASHVDIVDCQIFAGAGRLMGRSITPRDYSAAREKMTQRWATKASARDATFYALRFLSQCLLNNRGGPLDENGIYSGRDDYLLNRPWVIYVAVLVVWCYGYALDGPIASPPVLATVAEQQRDMEAFLRRVGGVRDPNELATMKGRNQCLGLLMILRDGFANTRWELLSEASNLLRSCIDKLRGGTRRC
ncbi:putative C2H2 finger domain protein [Aspergillus clavatus NRRL 1]|uniref:C2H2 finger domain protein, putative n=1 Tax=Aspergillus clavatus (strain ATCC 1007 / CBS 513.65 / DSM 816 / NCTC 3887 / NRRL 1 / QM 1276 / 107) TaxID=344612 RepID=A1CDS9_ASPCL|nr:C2H2 finger domain protein, putative [Aspergillus clavatus NRRL 1]EAW12006.1 C2H2 finger domain protein, putative [Aspergillus clavatus NRRL 1]